jgi:hypothetical protein
MVFNIFRLFGLAGTGLAILAILLSALRYRGKQGERFSLLNHFISELGEVGVSPAAWIFNWGFIFAGLLLVPYIIEIGFIFGSLLGWLGTLAGVAAALSVTAVGIFPINNRHTHGIAAVTHFRAGLVMVFFFGLAILSQPAGHVVITRAANWLSLASFLAYASFLVLMTPRKPQEDTAEDLDPEQEPQRPRFLLLPMVEWAVFFSTILWLFGVTFLI